MNTVWGACQSEQFMRIALFQRAGYLIQIC